MAYQLNHEGSRRPGPQMTHRRKHRNIWTVAGEHIAQGTITGHVPQLETVPHFLADGEGAEIVPVVVNETPLCFDLGGSEIFLRGELFLRNFLLGRFRFGGGWDEGRFSGGG